MVFTVIKQLAPGLWHLTTLGVLWQISSHSLLTGKLCRHAYTAAVFGMKKLLLGCQPVWLLCNQRLSGSPVAFLETNFPSPAFPRYYKTKCSLKVIGAIFSFHTGAVLCGLCHPCCKLYCSQSAPEQTMKGIRARLCYTWSKRLDLDSVEIDGCRQGSMAESGVKTFLSFW